MRSVALREGDGEPVFLFPGLGGEASEFAILGAAMRTRRPLVMIELVHAPGDPAPQWETNDAQALESCAVDRQTVESMAAAAVALIRTTQPHGPYYLAGYSFGGLVALEAARALRASGAAVPFVGLIDAIYDRRYWPVRLFVGATVRRSVAHLVRLVRHPSAKSWSELRMRSGRLVRRITTRVRPRENTTQQLTSSAGLDDISARNVAVMAKWRPRAVEGPIDIFTSDGRADFGCESAALWRPWVQNLKVHRVAGSHRGVVCDVENVKALAEALDAALVRADSRSLRVLLATTFDWESSCRLAVELARAGCIVEAVAPPKSELHRLDCVSRCYRLGLVRPLMTLRRAIEASTADLVIPLDDRTRQALHEIYAHADTATANGAQLRERIRRSIGAPESYGHVYSRAATMALAADHGVRCPPTASVRSIADMRRWMADHRGPAVVKTDGSWGGREVVIVRDADEAVQAFKRLNRFPRWRQIAKRWIVDRDPWPLRMRLRRRRSVVSVQMFIDGRPGNVAVACMNGNLLGVVQAEVLRSAYPLGPSTTVRMIQNAEMRATAETMVRALGLTGLCGFDFVLETGSQRAHLIEVNPRATPTAHLVTADGVDLLATLRRALGRPGSPDRTTHYPDGIVELSTNVEVRRSLWSTVALMIARLSGVIAALMSAVGWSHIRARRAALQRARKLSPLD